ncbi:ribonucleoside-diphosphate reductase subunit alpha [Ralstonia insidiosa]|jgi:ribonucleoside-diphosphate reductase alpha chain|uniref:Ribonucleoside-diphosphate reductase n=1 Tax=Ralstonia insidiosa TaxID=190721 RepID=A0A192A7U9_9RALS|nr:MULTISPECIES: ribonucleoside-diphosphate reductase subunit alpha [Ralstonia]KMW44802.1 ribonucleotide-diphosphate reductase subunit alpha [Ralstonia sp. MD27]ANJ76336.1 ribonucleoside-diphosphate reductase subunit alpha [Ralstonia insidiosa]MBA9869813.1 ribonucleoside-diphosphate reductase subunit alpha [Ralstonia insidiosa]MBA9913479.1 ribonucleoside-diphosphate reductase subunit alpha [Ralstonia insidiosa]MBA9952809.1 ribonucleoside-diphosphate reductase subunit alpha [Ralstonia insidiosa
MKRDFVGAYMVIRRNGETVPFDASKIANALAKAFLYDAHGNPYRPGVVSLSAAQRERIEQLTQAVCDALGRRGESSSFHIEALQDQVELALMRAGEHEVARGYVLYREMASKKRAPAETAGRYDHIKSYRTRSGGESAFDPNFWIAIVESVVAGLEGVSATDLFDEAVRNLYNKAKEEEIENALILAARTKIELEPAYTKAAARLVLALQLGHDVFGKAVTFAELAGSYGEAFARGIKEGVNAELLADDMSRGFDLQRLASAIRPDRDRLWDYLGMQTLYDRYLLHIDGKRIELPQAFLMRVAMGLARNEVEREVRAIEFYEVLSTFDYMASTPTLFNTGSLRSQLSSCYLTTISDDLEGIYDGLKENALLSKFAGGLGNDWTRVRALGSYIKGTNGKSQGIVPFLKVTNDTAVAVNQGGKRKGAVCAYLETWHLDIEEFLELRKNTGDDRRRTHDMNTANWIPDLFMKRVHEGADWTLFSPNDVPDLHDLYGSKFEARYKHYEALADAGTLKHFKRLPAVDLWRKMLGLLFETGHPWITFKDPCNIRSPQQHVGVVHSSNLCTEITLNTNDSEIAVCNLGSVNLVAHLVKLPDGSMALDHQKLRRTVRIAMRMLDNVIDMNFYAVAKARASNMRHRPVGLGMMGYQDSLYVLGIPFGSEAAVDFSDRSMEAICYYAYEASSDLAVERGVYPSYNGSLWSKGILPLDSIDLLVQERGEGYLDIDRSSSMDWDALREKIGRQGMRNSNCVAIAPTATISNIVGVSASNEPQFQNLYVKSNLSGEFTLVNEYLVADLKKLGIWDEVMLSDLKFYDGSVQKIDRVPDEIKARYATAFEVEPRWSVEAGARRQKWIDQAQSLNIYMAGASGKKLDEVYKLAWLRGLKTTYYLRTIAATSVEKSTVALGTLNAVAPSSAMATQQSTQSSDLDVEGRVCMFRPGDPDSDGCQACQ